MVKREIKKTSRMENKLGENKASGKPVKSKLVKRETS